MIGKMGLSSQGIIGHCVLKRKKNTCVWEWRTKAKVAPLTIILNDPLWGYVLFTSTIPDSAGLEVLIPTGGECAKEHWTTSYGCCQWTLNSVFRGPVTMVKAKASLPSLISSHFQCCLGGCPALAVKTHHVRYKLFHTLLVHVCHL